MRPLFIVFEGVDGAGKGTQVERLTAALMYPFVGNIPRVWRTREPTGFGLHATTDGTPLAYLEADPHAKALLFAADRRAHQRHINRELAGGLDGVHGRHVICDRYTASMMAYQHAAGCDLEWLANLDAGCRVPDLMIFLHLDPAEAHRREVARGDGPAQRRDLEHAAYHQAIVLLRARGWRIEVVDGSGTVDEVFARVLEAVRGVR